MNMGINVDMLMMNNIEKGKRLLQIIGRYRESNQSVGVYELSNGEFHTIEHVHRKLFHTNLRIISILNMTQTGREALQQIFN